MKYTKVWALSAVMICVAACDEDTSSIGVAPDTDLITTSSQDFEYTTRSVLMDSVIASSAYSYLGLVADPETGSTIKAEFVAQFHTSEDYVLPDASTIVKNEQGAIVADSAEVRLYFNDYYGDGTNPMRLAVYELNRENMLDEGTTYYSDTDLSTYVSEGAQPLVQKVFTPSDYSLTDDERTSSTHYDNVRIKLPIEFGTRLLNTAIDHPEYFKDSWQFTHNVLPGFYFQLRGGMGTMLKLDVSALNIYFRYVRNDSTYVGVARFSATQEVIQSTCFMNSDLTPLLDDDKPYTYLKTPAGIATEVTLPVDAVYEGHESDSLSRARLIFTRYNPSTDNALGTPSSLLLLRKADRHSFFVNRQVSDNITSYTTSFESSYNTYSFSNISRLLAYLYHEKQQGMAAQGLTSAQWNERYPDWNKVVLLPVNITTTTNSTTGISSVVSVSHDFSLSSARLVGGSVPQKMQVIYSSYK